ncbi:U-box domain-containing protein 21-like [Senna tora]|uniref:U-box domain-containing protein n=1 Tax=Senna tora TaxID=362788 RepID=A0A834TH70_9FABA|nr:U-box domain-containing protein 21-like [Senna tora]
MVLGWRRRKTSRRRSGGEPTAELVIPNHFRCPISLDLMKDPVTLSTGITYDRDDIERWFLDGNSTCPVTNQPLRSSDLIIPNHTLRVMIQHWCVQNRQHGIERIPTPRTPISPPQVAELLCLVKSSAHRATSPRDCLESVRKLARWADESERNRRCIVDNGGTAALAAAFDAFANDSIERNLGVLEEILSALNWMFPMEIEAQKCLGSKASLQCLVWFLKHQDLRGKEKSMVALKEILSFGDEKNVETLGEIEGIKELLVGFINKRINPTITKASLSALGVLDSICSCGEGREEAYGNALTIPVLVKKILRVSAMATDCSVSALWKLCKNDDGDDEEEGRVLIEALQVGAFQKLLLVLQVGCSDETKVKATELLKILNPYRVGLECIEDSDFKNLKRSY